MTALTLPDLSFGSQGPQRLDSARAPRWDRNCRQRHETAAFPDARIGGKVAYVDPHVRSETRTARIRVEVPNPQQQLRLGM